MNTKPLTPRQAQILAAPDKLTDKTREALLIATGHSRQMLDRELERLDYHRLIIRTRTGTGKGSVLQLGITMAGRRAMADFAQSAKNEKPATVPPPTFRTSSIAAWPGRPAPYYRNSGHPDLPSRGVAC